MAKLQKEIEEQAAKIPQILLKKIIERKLKEQNIDSPGFLSALVSHIWNRRGQNFIWDDGKGNVNENVHISFTDQDLRELEDGCKDFIQNQLPEVLKGSIDDTAQSIIRRFEREWPETKIEERHNLQKFRDRLELRWAAGLDPLRMLLIASREVGEVFARRLLRSRSKRGTSKRQAILALHLRACQTTLEILTLLENGLPDGAYARWRTLYEISVVGFFIDRFGDDAAERYIAHDIVSMRDSTVNEFEHAGQTYDPAVLTGVLKEQEDAYNQVIVTFGTSFKSPYGWASHSLKISAPRFQDLEKAVDWEKLPPSYKSSSYKIHAGIAGTIRTLGSIGNYKIIHAGATNAGLHTPAIHAAYSLLHVTSLVMGKTNDLENQIKMKSLIMLRDRVLKQCERASRKLERDELGLRKS
jgi:Family of unknown function (DUF5677)